LLELSAGRVGPNAPTTSWWKLVVLEPGKRTRHVDPLSDARPRVPVSFFLLQLVGCKYSLQKSLQSYSHRPQARRHLTSMQGESRPKTSAFQLKSCVPWSKYGLLSHKRGWSSPR
jgi:hypothetical protein